MALTFSIKNFKIKNKLLSKFIKPFGYFDPKTIFVLALFEIIIGLSYWHFFASAVFPRPYEVLLEFYNIITSNDFLEDLFSSLRTTTFAMFYAIVISLFFCYASKLSWVRPITIFLTKCRFLTLTGLIFVFTMVSSSSESLKINLLVVGICPFFITSLLSTIDEIDKQEYELCYTLKYSKWRTLYEVIIVGRLDQVIEVIRQNFAITWLMITMVEAKNMSGGGIGTMLIISDKYLQLNKVFAILLIVFLIGIFFDWFLNYIRYNLFPYLKVQNDKK